MPFSSRAATPRRLALLVYALLPLSGSALTFNATFVDSAGETWTAERRGVVNQAIADWTDLIHDNQTVSVTFDFRNAGTSGYGARWVGSTFAVATGANILPWTTGVTHTVHFNADLFYDTYPTWFDPTPTTSGDIPYYSFDLLTDARHELGHVMGFVDGFFYENYNQGNRRDKWESLISAGYFDPSGLNVQMDADHGHTAQSLGRLMSPSMSNGFRRSISTTEVDMLIKAYGYNAIPEPATYGGLCGASALALAIARRRKRRA